MRPVLSATFFAFDVRPAADRVWGFASFFRGSAVSTASVQTPHTLPAPRIAAASAASAATRRQLLVWMFQFLKPVPGHAFLAAFYLAVSILLEVAVTRYFGTAVDQIKQI